MKKNTNCNSSAPDTSMDKSLKEVANLEAGTDIDIYHALLKRLALVEAGLIDELAEDGVTEDAPYKNLADYTMIDNEGIINNQSS